MIVSWYGIRKYPFDDPCRIAGHNCHSRNILCYHTTSSHNGSVTNLNARQYRGIYTLSKPCLQSQSGDRMQHVHTYNLIKYSLHKLQYKSFQYQNIALPLRKNIIMARLMILIINVNNEDQICLTDILKSQRCFLFSIS